MKASKCQNTKWPTLYNYIFRVDQKLTFDHKLALKGQRQFKYLSLSKIGSALF